MPINIDIVKVYENLVEYSPRRDIKPVLRITERSIGPVLELGYMFNPLGRPWVVKRDISLIEISLGNFDTIEAEIDKLSDRVLEVLNRESKE